MLRSIGKQSEKPVESVLKKNSEATMGRINNNNNNAREADGSAAEEAVKRRNIQTSRLITFFSQLPSSHWVQSMPRVASSFRNSVASLLISLATTEKSAFYFSDSPF